MRETKRDKFLKRISTVGGGTREQVQMLLGGIVYDLRDQIVEGLYGDDELDSVVAFHDATEELWRASLSTRPVVAPDVLLARLKQLYKTCQGPVVGYRERLARAIGKAEILQASKELREGKPEGGETQKRRG